MSNSKGQEASSVFEKEYQAAFNAFVEEFQNENDRAAVIIGTAKLDYLLYQILTKFFIPSVNNNDDLLEGDSPLSTFSSRINICYRLGIIDAKFARALHLTRKIRNSFAHEISGCKLDSGPHRDRVRELVAPYCSSDMFIDFKELFIRNKGGVAADFFTILGLMILGLEFVFEDLEPLSPKEEPATIIWDGYESVIDKTSAKDDKEKLRT